jgi:hypothetical protein
MSPDASPIKGVSQFFRNEISGVVLLEGLILCSRDHLHSHYKGQAIVVAELNKAVLNTMITWVGVRLSDEDEISVLELSDQDILCNRTAREVYQGFGRHRGEVSMEGRYATA